MTDKLKLIYGNPVKVLRQIRRKHLSIGDLNHSSASKRFQQVMQHKLLIQRTHSCLSKAENKEEANSVLYIRDELFNLIKLLPKDKLDMARAMHMTGNQNGFQLTHRTTAKQMYTFFTQAIAEMYEELEAEISITSNTVSSTELVTPPTSFPVPITPHPPTSDSVTPPTPAPIVPQPATFNSVTPPVSAPTPILPDQPTSPTPDSVE